MGICLGDLNVSSWTYFLSCKFFLMRRASVPAVVWSVDLLAPPQYRFAWTTGAALVCGFLASPFDSLYSRDLASLFYSDEMRTTESKMFSCYRGVYVALYWGLLLPVNLLLKALCNI